MTEPLRFHLQVDPRRTTVRPASPRVGIETNPVARAILVATPGPKGNPGPPGSGAQIFGEVPTGAQDGVNAVFTTAFAFLPNATAVFVNGLREKRSIGYVETSSTTITFSAAPGTGDDIMIDYIVA